MGENGRDDCIGTRVHFGEGVRIEGSTSFHSDCSLLMLCGLSWMRETKVVLEKSSIWKWSCLRGDPFIIWNGR